MDSFLFVSFISFLVTSFAAPQIVQNVATSDHIASSQHNIPSYHYDSGHGSKKSSGHKSNKHGNSHHGHKVSDGGAKSWNSDNYGKHGSHSDHEDMSDKSNSWNDWGTKEKYVKDRGHGFIKAFSWDREEGVKDNWGSKGESKSSKRSKDKGSNYHKHANKNSAAIDWSKAVIDDDTNNWNALNSGIDLSGHNLWSSGFGFFPAMWG